MLQSMTPRSVSLWVKDVTLRRHLKGFFIDQGWDVDVTRPMDLVVFDAARGVGVLRALRRRDQATPALFLKRAGMRPRGFKHLLVLEAPFTPDRLRDACGALLRRRIKLVPRRRASA